MGGRQGEGVGEGGRRGGGGGRQWGSGENGRWQPSVNGSEMARETIYIIYLFGGALQCGFPLILLNSEPCRFRGSVLAILTRGNPVWRADCAATPPALSNND